MLRKLVLFVKGRIQAKGNQEYAKIIYIFRNSYLNSLRTGRSGDRILAGARFSASVQTGPGAHPASCKMGTGSFLGVKSGRSVTLIPHPLLVPLVMKE